MHFFTADQKVFVEKNLKGRSQIDLLKVFNEQFGTDIKINQLRAFIKNNSFTSGLDARFKPDHTPFNKGMKGTGGWEPTQFKVGNKPANWVPLGSERINADGYVDIKVQDGKLQKNWKGKHIITWEHHNGPVPKRSVIIFGDGNRRNFEPDNLIMVSRKKLSTLNKHGLIQKSADLTRTGVIVADIIQKLTDRKRSKKG